MYVELLIHMILLSGVIFAWINKYNPVRDSRFLALESMDFDATNQLTRAGNL